MKKLLAVSLVTILAVACGGNVVVDGDTTSTTGTGGATTTPIGGGGASCLLLPPRSSLSFCGGSSGSGMCAFSYNCGTPGDTWESSCAGDSCQCTHNGTFACSCAVSGTNDICATMMDCCFQ